MSHYLPVILDGVRAVFAALDVGFRDGIQPEFFAHEVDGGIVVDMVIRRGALVEPACFFVDASPGRDFTTVEDDIRSGLKQCMDLYVPAGIVVQKG